MLRNPAEKTKREYAVQASPTITTYNKKRTIPEKYIPEVNISAGAHNSLAGLQGGTAGQYYHTTAAQNTLIAALGTISSQAASAVSITGGTITGITDLTVADGGTGVSTFTANGVLIGNGSGALTVTAEGATNTVLHGVTGADPSFSAVVEGDISLSDVATNDSSTSKHGFLKKLDNTATNFMNGAGNWAVPAGTGAGFTSIVVQVFTSSDTYTPTAGMDYCWVRCQAPGGGSGGADASGVSNAAGGSGGGEFAEGVFTSATIGVSQTVTIGAVGTAGSNAGGNGGVGGTTSLGALLTCIGGSGGIGTGSTSTSQAPRLGGIGGTGGTGGNFRVAGGKGNPGYVFVPTGVTSDPLIAGDGGDSVIGCGAKGTNTIDAAGTAGQNYGGGASGATEDDTTGQAGAAGGAGIIIVVEFIG